MAPLFLLLACVTGAAAQVTDMSNRLFLFANQSIYNYVILEPAAAKPLTAFTICLRVFTEVPQHFAILSASTTDQDNEILISYGNSAETDYSFAVGGEVMHFTAFKKRLGRDHICATWDSATGVVQLWVNSEPLARKVMKKGYSIQKNLKVILGQAPDSYGSSFHKKHSFVGEIGDVHLWDEVAWRQRIYQARRNNPYVNGNVISWRSLRYEITGDVLVQASQIEYDS